MLRQKPFHTQVGRPPPHTVYIQGVLQGGEQYQEPYHPYQQDYEDENNINANEELHDEDRKYSESQEYENEDREDILFNIDERNLSPIINPSNGYQHNTGLEARRNRNQYLERRMQMGGGSEYWRIYVNPDVNRYYQQIMNKKNKRQLKVPPPQKNSREEQLMNKQEQNGINSNKSISHAQNKVQSIAGSKKSKNDGKDETFPKTREAENQFQGLTVEQMKQKYQEKVSVLEHQNANLRDQLFYLRAAIMAQYEERQSIQKEQRGSQKKI